MQSLDQHAGHAEPNAEAPGSITILGIPVHNLSYAQALAAIEGMVAAGRPHQLVTVNPEFLVIARDNAPFREALLRADLVLADGAGLQLAALLQGRRFVSRVPGSELVYRLLPLAAERGWRLFFLGAGPGVAERAAEEARRSYPALHIDVDGADPCGPSCEAALARIRECRPHILLVAYGAPAQDLWIAQHGAAAGVPVMMGIGGTLDYLAGVAQRPPKIWHTLGLEWLYRLYKQPWRWRRQLRLPLFGVLVLAERLRELARR